MSYDELELFFSVLILGIMYLYTVYQWRKEHKKNNQLQSDYDNLMETVKKITHENNVLRNQGTDTK